MIVDLVLALLTWLLEVITSPLEVGSLGLPASSAVAEQVGEWAGPLNAWVPLEEAVASLMLVVTVWMPAALVYVLVSWIYRHIPMIGGG